MTTPLALRNVVGLADSCRPGARTEISVAKRGNPVHFGAPLPQRHATLDIAEPRAPRFLAVIVFPGATVTRAACQRSIIRQCRMRTAGCESSPEVC